MNECERTRLLLTEQAQKYPHMQVRDLFKYLYQSAFGCEHLVASREGATEGITREWQEMQTFPGASCQKTEALDGAYGRVCLSWLRQGLTPSTLGGLFCASAKKEEGGKEELEKKLAIAREMIQEGLLPFSVREFDMEAETWRYDSYPAIRHSEIYRAKYKPAYRVIAAEYLPFLPLLARIDRMLGEREVVLAIEGGSACGKTTLSALLERIYGCTVFHMDDFFLRPKQRTPARYAEVGGNVDRERFLEEVLVPLKEGRPVVYRKFDCSKQTLGSPIHATKTPLTVIEGAYSMHPDLVDFYDLSVFLDISEELQRERIKKRNTPPVAKRFFEEWIPLENIYFSKTAERRLRCALLLAEAAGPDGMVAGQVLDTLHEPKTEEALRQVHILKTGAMIRAACVMGCIAAGGDNAMCSAAGEYASEIGMAFQIRDDLLDVIGNAEEFGKPIGSDRDEGKCTFVDLLGIEGCEQAVLRCTETAKSAVEAYDVDGFLTVMADQLAIRKK